jgi:NADH-quinone oxidoreductase subunit C
LKLHQVFQFKELIDVFGIDYINYNFLFRFEINYSILSIQNNLRVFIKVFTDEYTGVKSICSLFPGALWFEREIWDMFGVFFYDHLDLRRILTDYGFNGFPLRKDFPLTGFYELRYCDDKASVIYERISLAQEYRSFHFLNPWNL